MFRKMSQCGVIGLLLVLAFFSCPIVVSSENEEHAMCVLTKVNGSRVERGAFKGDLSNSSDSLRKAYECV